MQRLKNSHWISCEFSIWECWSVGSSGCDKEHLAGTVFILPLVDVKGGAHSIRQPLPFVGLSHHSRESGF